MPRPGRAHLSRAACGLLVVVAAVVSVSAGQREPYETASPFVGLYQLAEVHTSNDEYSVWLSWPATTARLVVGPCRWGVDAASPDTGRPWVEVHCRADGGQPLGYSGPLRWGASLVIPLHPDEPNVPNVWHPLYWWRAATGREFERTPVTVQLNGARAPGALVRHTIDYSFARPDLEVEIPPAGVLAAAVAGALRVQVTGPAVELDLTWGALTNDAAGAAGLLARHCPRE